MTNYSTIKHRKQTKLKIETHKKIGKAIKLAREMNLLNFHNHLLSFHKIPLRTIEEDYQDNQNYDINLETGTIVQNKDERITSGKSYFRNRVNSLSKSKIDKHDEEKEMQEKIIREATKHCELEDLINLENKGLEIRDQNETFRILKSSDVSEEMRESLKMSFELMKEKFEDISFIDFLDLLIAENEADITKLEELSDFSKLAKTNTETVNYNYNEILKTIEDIKSNINPDLLDQMKNFKQNQTEKIILNKIGINIK